MMTALSCALHEHVSSRAFSMIRERTNGGNRLMNRSRWQKSKALRRRAFLLGLAGVVLLAASGFLTLLIVRTIVL